MRTLIVMLVVVIAAYARPAAVRAENGGILLQNGRFLKGSVKAVEGKEVVFEIAGEDGGSPMETRLKFEEIKPLSLYEILKPLAAADDAKAQYELGLFTLEHGMFKYALEHFSAVELLGGEYAELAAAKKLEARSGEAQDKLEKLQDDFEENRERIQKALHNKEWDHDRRIKEIEKVGRDLEKTTLKACDKLIKEYSDTPAGGKAKDTRIEIEDEIKRVPEWVKVLQKQRKDEEQFKLLGDAKERIVKVFETADTTYQDAQKNYQEALEFDGKGSKTEARKRFDASANQLIAAMDLLQDQIERSDITTDGDKAKAKDERGKYRDLLVEVYFNWAVHYQPDPNYKLVDKYIRLCLELAPDHQEAKKVLEWVDKNWIRKKASEDIPK